MVPINSILFVSKQSTGHGIRAIYALFQNVKHGGLAIGTHRESWTATLING